MEIRRTFRTVKCEMLVVPCWFAFCSHDLRLVSISRKWGQPDNKSHLWFGSMWDVSWFLKAQHNWLYRWVYTGLRHHLCGWISICIHMLFLWPIINHDNLARNNRLHGKVVVSYSYSISITILPSPPFYGNTKSSVYQTLGDPSVACFRWSCHHSVGSKCL